MQGSPSTSNEHTHVPTWSSLAGLRSQNWPAKVAATAAISALCEAKAPTLEPHAVPTLDLLVQELPGRIWGGKESLLAAAGALGSFCTASVDAQVCICRHYEHGSRACTQVLAHYAH